MQRYSLPPLTAKSATALAAKQEKVDANPDRKTRYECATALFRSKSNAVFAEVRDKLRAAAPVDGSCYYCERDRFRDIEHIRPKRHFPELAFDWSNYVFACTICNQDRKRDTFGIIAAGILVTIDRTLDFAAPIPTGTMALIDTRNEDPMAFLKLDLDTGGLVPIGDDLSQLRGGFTRDLFDLDEASLMRARRQNVISYRSYLARHMEARANNDDAAASRIWGEICQLPHPTILAEMRRQKDEIDWLGPLVEAMPAFV